MMAVRKKEKPVREKMPTGLTKAQKIVYKGLKENDGAYLKGHIKITDTRCYRLMTGDHKPLLNIRTSVVDKLLSLGILTKSENLVVINQ